MVRVSLDLEIPFEPNQLEETSSAEGTKRSLALLEEAADINLVPERAHRALGVYAADQPAAAAASL